MSNLRDIDQVPANLEPKLRGLLRSLREHVRSLTGLDGQGNRVILSESAVQEIVNEAVANLPGGGGGGGTPPVYVPDLTAPPTPAGVTVTAGLTNIFIETNNPTFSEGHGYARTIVYGQQWEVGQPDPVFSGAVKVHEFVGSVGSFTVRPGAKWSLWLKWLTEDGVESTAPSGGTNGHVAEAGKIGNADLDDLIVQARNLAEGAVDLMGDSVKADTAFGALAVGYTVTQYLVATSGILENLVVGNAQIADLSAAKLTAGDGTIGGNLKSSTYSAVLKQGWIVRPDGFAEFNDVVMRGTVFAAAGEIGGNQLGANYIQSETWNLGYGWHLRSDGVVQIRNSTGDRVFDFGATDTQPIISLAGALTVLANGDATFNGDGTFSGSLSGATGLFLGALGAGVLTPADLDSIREEFTAAGTHSITIPAKKAGWSTMTMRITLVGAGAGGGGGYYSWAPNTDPAAGGGGGGAGTRSVFEVPNVTPGDTVSITVGAAGNGGNPSKHWGGSYGGSIPAGNGQNGGASSFSYSTYVGSAAGGTGGTGGSANYAKSGGGYVALPAEGWGWATAYPVSNVPGGSMNGQPGQSLLGSNQQQHVLGGSGGASFFGAGGQAGNGWGPVPTMPAPTAFGAGGGGGGSGQWGAAGRGGYVLVEFYDPAMVVTNNRYQALIAWLDSRGFGSVPTPAR